MVVKGYNDWLTKERLEETELEWAKMDRSKLLQKIADFSPQSIIEFCCGTGWIAKGIPKDVVYIGIDANPHCMDLATEKNPEDSRIFIQEDVRKFEVLPDRQDMALAFSCLKHFTLADWDAVYGKVLDSGKHTLCSVYLAEDDREDPGYGYPHTAVSREHLERIVHEAGHEILDILVMPPLVGPKEPLVLTKLIEVTEDDGFLL
jgi:SAM-dependent methyltransferase